MSSSTSLALAAVLLSMRKSPAGLSTTREPAPLMVKPGEAPVRSTKNVFPAPAPVKLNVFPRPMPVIEAAPAVVGL